MVKKVYRYSDEALQEFKTLIAEKLASAKIELVYAKEQIHKLNESGERSKVGNLDNGTPSMEREYLNQIVNRQRRFIRDLEFALIRIENKTYGVCRDTGELINKKRLKLVPHATLSMKAKRKRDK